MISAEVNALKELRLGRQVAQGIIVHHPFFGSINPKVKTDVLWIKGVLENYVAQDRFGLACMLSSFIPQTKEVIANLNKLY